MQKEGRRMAKRSR